MSNSSNGKALDVIQANAVSLSKLGVYATATELQCPPNLPLEDWMQLMRGLGTIVQASAWYVGDGLIHGEAAYGQMYAQAEAELGMSEQTLTNYVYTCRHVPPDVRKAELSFGHHSAVAALDPQQQQHFLQQAVEGKWTRSELREAIRSAGLTSGRQAALPATAGHAEAVAAVDAAAAAAGTVRPPVQSVPMPEAAAPELPYLTAVEDAARVVWGSTMPVSEVPPQLAATFMAVPVGMVQQLGLALEQLDNMAGGIASPAAVVPGAAATIDSLVATDDYPCQNDPPCAYVASTQEDLWAHLREEHGWQ